MGTEGYKIFVGALPPNCTTQTLQQYFGQFGNIVDCIVMMDRETGKTRGFGFVTYDTPDPLDTIMAMHADHKLCDKWVDCKRATPETREGRDKGGSGGKGGNKGEGRQFADGGGKGGGYPDLSGSGGARGGVSWGDSRPGDWRCGSCGANVFASKDSCFKCGARKTMGSGGGGGGAYSGATVGSVMAGGYAQQAGGACGGGAYGGAGYGGPPAQAYGYPQGYQAGSFTPQGYAPPPGAYGGQPQGCGQPQGYGGYGGGKGYSPY